MLMWGQPPLQQAPGKLPGCPVERSSTVSSVTAVKLSHYMGFFAQARIQPTF